jgi:hypothetical protein
MMLKAMAREVQKEHSCTKTLWLEGRRALRLQKRHGRIKEKATRQDACLRRGTLLLRLNDWICYGAIYLSLESERSLSLSLSPRALSLPPLCMQ